MDMEKRLQEIQEETERLEREIEELEKRKRERENRLDFGIVYLLNGSVGMELLMDANLFNSEQLAKLEDITTQLHMLILDVQKDYIEEENDGE